MIYFADRYLNVIGQASTKLPAGLVYKKDKTTEDVEAGVSVFEFDVTYDKKTRDKVIKCAEVGNHILYKRDGESKLYTIIDFEDDTKKQTVYVYAEDDGMDLLNEVVGVYEADKAYSIDHYINKYAANAGFVIGINEAKGLTRQLSWDGESTATARINSVATQFGGCEISFSFDIDRLNVVKKYINIYKERGKDVGITLRLNKDIDSIITTKSISNLATALYSVGGTPEDENTEDDIEPEAITLKGYKYDDGDFYVDTDGVLKSRKALERWGRFLWKTDDTQRAGGHIVKQYSYDTLSQKELCAHTVTELKKICDMEVNYKVELKRLPDNVKIGDRVNIVDEAGKLYLSSRILVLETSETGQEYKATIGEHLIKGSGIHQKVADLAAQFARNSQSAARALSIATSAKTAAESAQAQANSAAAGVQAAQEAATAARQAATAAGTSASQAQEKAAAAVQAAGKVAESVESLQTTITNAQTAAQQALQAAATADTKANEAKQAAENAQTKADQAATAAGTAQTKADRAVETAGTAKSTADQAVQDAEKASTTAAAAKLDAENAQKDIDALGDSLTTLENTMSADYARNTDLTESTANLQTQIKQNAAQITFTAKKVQEIDETANDAYKLMEGALALAEKAQKEADQAAEDAEAAQNAADAASQAAEAAQAEATTARAAADLAQSVADKADSDLEAAKADLETVQSRVDATEEEIASAQQAVETARQAANTARTAAIAANGTAAEAQAMAAAAAMNANVAQETANTAASNAALAQNVANEAKGDAEAAQAAAAEAEQQAAEAQRTAQSAVENAETAQAAANDAVKQAAAATQAVEIAQAKVEQASTDLMIAQQELANIRASADSTAEEVTAAEEAVRVALAAADFAQEEAETAQAAADTANANATAAQAAADTAHEAASSAQQAANRAYQAASKAQGDVYGLANRVENAETQMSQNANQIALAATKTYVSKTLGGYYTRTETDAAIQVKADGITSTVAEAQNTADNANKSVVAAQSAIKQLADSISSLVRDGNGGSMVKQDSSGLYYFDISGIEAGLSATANALNELDGIVLDINGQIDVLKSTAAALQARTEYIRSYTDENDRPCLELGEGDSTYKAYITNEGIRLMDGTASPTIVTRQMLVIEKTMVRKEIQIGDDQDSTISGVWILKRRSNGNCGLMWKAVTK